jgi:predicted TIM-barrel fold metal-dependent hydrolase
MLNIIVLLTLCSAQDLNFLDSLLVKDYKPNSIYNIPSSVINKAKFPIIDMHSHAYPDSEEEIAVWVKNMEEVGIEKTIILSKATGAEFDSVYALYSKYGDSFDVWCGFDYSGSESDGWEENAVAELERCFNLGAKGVGELGDKGWGLYYSHPKSSDGIHIDDPRMDPLLEKCAELGMPINIHIAEPIWMYEKMDHTNDGLSNAFEWRLDNKPNILDHSEMILTLENALKRHPNTTIIACHFANCSYDLSILARLFDNYPKFYADISARYAETAPIPRYMRTFYTKYQDRLLYGTDMGYDKDMYKITFRILESFDEHFYEADQFGYHWSMNGFGLNDAILRKIYRENSLNIINR